MLKWVRRVLAVIGGLFFMAIVLPATVSASSANTYPVHTKHGGPVNVRSGPGLEFPVVDHVRNGQRVTIHCTTTTAGTVWDDISGHGRFVSDDYIKTGTSDPVAPPATHPTRPRPARPRRPPTTPTPKQLPPPAPPEPASGDKTYPVRTQGDDLNVRSGPGLEFPVVDHVRNGQRVTIHCTTTTAGTVWDDISGHGRFVSDDYIKTGTSDPVAPPCNTPDPAASGPSPAAADHADAETAPAPAPPEPASGDKTYPVRTQGDDLNVRSGPGLEFPVVDHVRNGQRVTIHCTTTTAGTVWDDISGHGRFVSDDYIKTGTSDPVAPPATHPTRPRPARPRRPPTTPTGARTLRHSHLTFPRTPALDCSITTNSLRASLRTTSSTPRRVLSI